MEKFDTIKIVELADEKLHVCKLGIGKPISVTLQGDDYVVCNYCQKIIGINKDVQK